MADAPLTPIANAPNSVPVKPPVAPAGTLAQYSRFTQTLVNGWRAISKPVSFGGVNVPWLVIWGVGLLALAALANSGNVASAQTFAFIILLGAILRYVAGGA